jgi:RNA polymerase sigma factor (sigma-70 family)
MLHIDNRYIVGLRTNDSQTIAEIYKNFAGKIKAMVLKNNGDENDAADIFQEALVYIYNRSLNTEFALTCPFEAYLYMVCKNRWLNEIEKRKTKKVTFVEDTGFISNNADDDGVKNMKLKEDKFEIIQAALQKVGEGCSELLKLSWKGLGMEEVGVQLNMTYAYVRKKKSECMGKLVDLVKKENNYQVLFN